MCEKKEYYKNLLLNDLNKARKEKILNIITTNKKYIKKILSSDKDYLNVNTKLMKITNLEFTDNISFYKFTTDLTFTFKMEYLKGYINN